MTQKKQSRKLISRKNKPEKEFGLQGLYYLLKIAMFFFDNIDPWDGDQN